MSILDSNRYVGYVQISAAQAGLGLEMRSGDVQPHTNGKTIVVAKPDLLWSEEQWDEWYYTVEHEIGHQRPVWRDWREVAKAKKLMPNTLLGWVVNMVSDQAQEYDRYGELDGVDMRLGEGRRKWMTKDIKPATHTEGDELVCSSIWIYDALIREEWNNCMAGVSDQLRRGCSPEVTSNIEKLVASGLKPYHCKNEWETYQMAKDMLDVLGIDADEEERKMQEEHDKKGKEKGKGEGEDGEKGEGEGEEGTVFSKYVHHAHDYSSGTCHKSSHITYDDWHRSRDHYEMRKVDVIDFDTGKGKEILGGDYHRVTVTAVAGKAFAKKVRTLLAVLSEDRWASGKIRGRVSARNLYRHRAGDPRMFKKREINQTLDTAVTLAVDYSGSMGSRKMTHAIMAAALLNEAIGELGVPVEITGFTDLSDPVEMQFKKFDRKLSTSKLLERMSEGTSVMSNNADGESLLHMYPRLAARREKKKIMIVLSDGSPAGSGRGCDATLLSRVVPELEKKVNVYGIGIMDSNVEHFYKNRCVIKNAEELESKLLEVIKTQMLKG